MYIHVYIYSYGINTHTLCIMGVPRKFEKIRIKRPE